MNRKSLNMNGRKSVNMNARKSRANARMSNANVETGQLAKRTSAAFVKRNSNVRKSIITSPKKSHRGSVNLFTQNKRETEENEFVSKEKIKQFRKISRFSIASEGKSSNNEIIDEEEKELFEYNHIEVESSMGVFHPDSTLKMAWNIIGMFFIVFQSVMIPFMISFNYTPSVAIGYLQITQDFYFIIDIFLTFNTGFYSKGLLTMTRKEIVLNYLKLWLWLDLAASFPYSMIVSVDAYFNFESINTVQSGSNATDLIRILKLMRMMRMIRLLRIVKLKKFLTYLEDYMMSDMINMFIQFLQLGLVFIFIAHLGACFWFYLGLSEFQDLGYGWILDAQIIDADISVQYIASLYYYITTMCTIGYGDIVPKTPKERLYASFNMLLACGVFAYIIGSLGTVLSTRYDHETNLKQKIGDLVHYMSSRKIDKNLKVKVRKYLEHVMENNREHKIDEGEVLDLLNKNLRDEIILHLNGQILKDFTLLNNYEEFSIVLAYIMYEETLNPNEKIFVEGEESTKLYFITKGTVVIYDEHTKIIYKELDNTHFGEFGFFGEKPRIATAESQFFASLTYMTIDDFKTQAAKYIRSDKTKGKEFKEYFEDMFKTLQKNKYLSNCYLCNTIGHFAPLCPRLNDIDEFYKFKFLDEAKYKTDNEIETIFSLSKTKNRSEICEDIYIPFSSFFDNYDIPDKPYRASLQRSSVSRSSRHFSIRRASNLNESRNSITKKKESTTALNLRRRSTRANDLIFARKPSRFKRVDSNFFGTRRMETYENLLSPEENRPIAEFITEEN